tara:strand:+ start:71 stop:238 length:168 start_codon:yes stop_codon:yes gene_type:complete
MMLDNSDGDKIRLTKMIQELDEIVKVILAPHNSKDELVPVDLYLFWSMLHEKPDA